MLMICWTPTQTDWLIECSSSPSGWWRWWIRVLSFRFLCVSSERVLKVGRIPYRLDNWDVSPRESVEGSALITNTGLPRSSGPPLPTNQHLHSSLKSSSSSSLSHLFTSFLRMRTNSFYDHLILHRHPQSALNYQSQPSRDCPLILLKSPIYYIYFYENPFWHPLMLRTTYARKHAQGEEEMNTIVPHKIPHQPNENSQS
jgi:hypothetical protein